MGPISSTGAYEAMSLLLILRGLSKFGFKICKYLVRKRQISVGFFLLPFFIWVKIYNLYNVYSFRRRFIDTAVIYSAYIRLGKYNIN